MGVQQQLPQPVNSVTKDFLLHHFFLVDIQVYSLIHDKVLVNLRIFHKRLFLLLMR